MQSRHRPWGTLVALTLALLAVACGSGRDNLEKRLSSLQEDVTRLQNTNDRLSERLQAIEIQRMQAAPAATAEPKEADARVVHPPLKVVKVGPGAENPPAEEPEEAPAPAEENGPRPVIKDYGAKPLPAWAPRLPKAGAAPRAAPSGLGQNQPGGVARAKPQGT